MGPWLADRFLRTNAAGWIDVATGGRIEVIMRRLSGERACARWEARCARLVMLWHSHLVPLVDYALIDEGRAIEAYEEHEPRSVMPRGAARIPMAIARWLRTRALQAGDIGDSHPVRYHGRVAWRPAEDTGSELIDGDGEVHTQLIGPVRDGRGRPLDRAIGLWLEAPPALEGVLAAIDTRGSSPVVVHVAAAPGVGATTLLAMVARESRRRGLCAVCPDVLLERPDLAPHLRDRSLVLLCDRDVAPSRLAAALARLAGQPIRLAGVVVAGHAVASENGVLMLRPWPPSRSGSRGLRVPRAFGRGAPRLARRAGGFPGRLVVRWLGEVAGRGTASSSRFRMVVPPRDDAPLAPANAVADRGPRWRAPVTGVSSPALDDGWQALANGRARDAAAIFCGRVAALQHPGPEMLTSVLRGWGLSLVDRARIDDGTRVLELAWALYDACRMTMPAEAALSREGCETGLALVRGLLWQNRLSEAGRVLTAVARMAEGADARVSRLRARLSWRSGNAPDAWRALGEAERCAHDPDVLAGVACDRARLALACGDFVACRAWLVTAVRHARRGHSRRRRLLVGTIQLARLVARGHRMRRPRVNRLAARLTRRDVPLLLRLRVEHALESAGRARTREVTAFVDRWSAEPLANHGWLSAQWKDNVMVNDLQAVLEICRDSGEPLRAAGDVCSLLRDRLGACIVSVYGAPMERGRLAQAGLARFDSAELARRTLETGTVVRPTPVADGIEAAAPVLYAGQRIGAVTCRWTIDREIAADAAQSLLVGAATALAPHVQGLNERATDAPKRASETLGLLGQSPTLVELRDRIRRVAGAPFHVLIEGESGSGKELVARALHLAGPRCARRFCAVNCAALTDELFEAELFGHARGAFTGAVGERPGLFEEADGGTLFLDEVGELSLRAQAKLLRAIQDGEIRRVGESLPRRVDARIVAATNRRLADEAAARRFRADLLYRLDVIRINVPPLRERPEDILPLARACWTEAAARVGSRATLHVETLAALARYHWPGNVRELQNVVRALAVSAPARGVVAPSRLPGVIAAAGGLPSAQTLTDARRSFEERFVRAALARAGDRPGRAARDLGLTRQGLRKLLRRLGIEDARRLAAGDTARPPC